MKSSGNGTGNTVVTVSDFIEAGKQVLHLELIAGEAGLKNRIKEAAINRPGLALAGFFEHFSFRRVQVLGLAECAYLSSLGEAEREKRLRDFFNARIPCVVISRNKKVFPEIITLAGEFNVPVLRTKMVTKYFVNAATFIMENLQAPKTKIQGTMVEIMGIGVLLEGAPGIGKSEAALGLIKKGYALVSDDITALRVDSAGALLGGPVRATRFHLEIRGIGIVHVPSLFGIAAVREEKKLDLIVSLQKMSALAEEDRSGCCEHYKSVLGVKIPQVIIPVGPGRDMVNVIETAALDQKLKRLGHDAAKELDERLMDLMTGGMNGSE